MAAPVIWLPLDGDLRNIGTGTLQRTSGTDIYRTDGKIGQKCIDLSSAVVFTSPEFANTSNTGFTVCFWMKVDSSTTLTGNWVDLCAFTDAKSGQNNGTFRFEACYASSLRACSWHDNATYNIIASATTNSVLMVADSEKNKWHHCCVTMGEDKVRSYVDGTLINDTARINSGGYFTGVFSLGQTSAIAGGMNDFRIYNKTLSQKEVKEIAQGLVLHYPLNETNYYGANLYTGSQDFSGSWINKSVWTTDTNQYNGFTILKRSAVWGGLAQNIDCIQNDIFTISFWAKMDSGGKLQSVHRSNLGNVTTGLTILSGNFTSSNVWVSESQNGTQWKRYWATLQITGSDVTYLQWRIENSVADKNLYIAGMSLVKGYGPTTWTPNKNDIIYKDDLIYDTSGFNHHGTLIGTPLITQINNDGCYAGSLNLNGTDQGIQFQSPDFNTFFNNVWTISFWIYSNGENGGRSIYFSSYNASPFWCLEKSTGNAIRYDWNSSVDQYGNSGKIVDGKWNHIVLVKYSNTSCKSYINGVLDKEMTTAVSALTLNNPIWRIGRDVRTGDGTPYKGNICDFRIYATALIEDDIKKLYNTSMSIDNLHKLHAYEYVENEITNPKFYKNGIVEVKEFIEQDDTSSNYTDKIIMDELIEI